MGATYLDTLNRLDWIKYEYYLRRDVVVQRTLDTSIPFGPGEVSLYLVWLAQAALLEPYTQYILIPNCMVADIPYR